jgi:diguanylate cyclase
MFCMSTLFVLPAAVGTFLLVNLLCACVALGVGFAAGVWFFGAKLAKPVRDAPAKKPSATQEDIKRSVERAEMAAGRVADLAKNVASDVGDHAAKIQAISADLAGIDRDSTGANAAVFSAMDQMLAANAELQQRLAQAEKQLASQAVEIKAHESEARTDSLTGLSNRRAFDDELKRRFAEWRRIGSPCSLVLLDIDFFKKFNDTHGHQVGDDVLKSVARVLVKQCHDMDLPCRYGGEEFAVIMPATQAAKACKGAERIRIAIENSTIVSDGKKLKVTCSLGVSQFLTDDDMAKLIRRADDALYTSKNAGRNCGHWHTGTTHVPITKAESVRIEKINPSRPEPQAEQQFPGGATFIQNLKRRVAESHRYGVPLSVLSLKIEEYDIINKKYGSPVARQMVETAWPVLNRVLRGMDIMAKLENGEFVVMMPGSTKNESAHTAKRMRTATEHCILPLQDRELKIRLRHGVATLNANETAQELLARARKDVIAPPTPARVSQ